MKMSDARSTQSAVIRRIARCKQLMHGIIIYFPPIHNPNFLPAFSQTTFTNSEYTQSHPSPFTVQTTTTTRTRGRPSSTLQIPSLPQLKHHINQDRHKQRPTKHTRTPLIMILDRLPRTDTLTSIKIDADTVQ